MGNRGLLFLAVGLVVLTVSLPCAAVVEAKPRRLVLSELTIDLPPGRNGSWVEIYNPTSRATNLQGVTIAYHGKEV